jgi:DNA-binding transcriptional MerR regulator
MAMAEWRSDAEGGQEPGDALSIGEAIGLLREEFPDVSVSKLRFLESQGLLSPARSDGGYRQFDPHDLERIRFILRQQRDHFLPLKVIKSKLTLWERGEEAGGEEPTVATGLLEPDQDHLTRSELVRRSGLTDGQLESLVEHGLIEPAAGDLFPVASMTVAIEARALFGQGLEARHLRAIRHAAEREADVLAQLTATLRRVRNSEARDQVRNLLEAAGESMISVHRAILVSELRKLIES